MDGENIVRPETASVAEPVSTGDVPKVEVKVEPPQPLTAEAIQKMIADETEKVRRSIQSEKDKAIAEVERRADRRIREAETERLTVESSLGELDEDTRTRIELAKYRARERNSQDSNREEQGRQSVLKAYDDFNANMTQYITELGIDPNKIELGDSTETLLVKQRRVLAQIGKVQKEATKAEKESVQKTVKDEVAKARRELGLDSNDTSVSTVNSAEYTGIPTKPEDFRKWIEKMPQEEYEKKWASKVTKMRREGLI